jgi:hypothetical protein
MDDFAYLLVRCYFGWDSKAGWLYLLNRASDA